MNLAYKLPLPAPVGDVHAVVLQSVQTAGSGDNAVAHVVFAALDAADQPVGARGRTVILADPTALLTAATPHLLPAIEAALEADFA